MSEQSEKVFVLHDDGPLPAVGLPFKTLPVDDFPAVRGLRRIPTAAEVKRYFARRGAAARAAKTPEAAADAEIAVQNQFYATHLLQWNVAASDGRDVPITAESVGRLPPPVWDQLEDVAIGYKGSDSVPN